jgi:hypothetical protein
MTMKNGRRWLTSPYIKSGNEKKLQPLQKSVNEINGKTTKKEEIK